MAKELFNQPLTTSPADDDRIGLGQPSVAGGKNIKWSEIVARFAKDFATVGTGGDYATIQLALADNKYNLKIISNITETVDWGAITTSINLVGVELYTVGVTALTCTADLFISAKNINFTGIAQTTFTTASRLLIYDTEFATGFTIYNDNVTIQNCSLNSGTITVNAVADNTTIDNCNTTTAIVNLGTNTKIINCNGSSNLLQNSTISSLTVTGQINASSAIVEADTAGKQSATKILISAYITDLTAVGLLENIANWTGVNYTGAAITGTYQGQKHYNTAYLFEAVADNSWIRIARA